MKKIKFVDWMVLISTSLPPPLSVVRIHVQGDAIAFGIQEGVRVLLPLLRSIAVQLTDTGERDANWEWLSQTVLSNCIQRC